MSFVKFIICGLFVFCVVKSISGQQRCRTPNGPIGYCVAFESCTPIYKMVQNGNWLTTEQADLISKSWCDSFQGVRTICCPMTKTKLAAVSNTLSNDDLSTHPNAKLLDLRYCGKSTNDKISHGDLTKPFEYPWMAIIRTREQDNSWKIICGGSLITKRFVLSAAHCMRDITGAIKIDSIVLGEHNIKTTQDCDNGECTAPIQEIPVDRQIPHPKFNLLNAENDIGLIRLKWSAEISYSVLPICLPFTKDATNVNLQKVIVTGWGTTENGPASDILLKGTLDVTPLGECASTYKKRYGSRVSIDSNKLCAFNGLVDTCKGDSGGPAAFLENSQFGPRYFQYGVVSAGTYSCGINYGIPGLYTRVTSYMKWILDNISE